MSYAGTYGADETCRHDSYWRSCGECSLVGPRATPEQVQAERVRRDDALQSERIQRETKLREWAQWQADMRERVPSICWARGKASACLLDADHEGLHAWQR